MRRRGEAKSCCLGAGLGWAWEWGRAAPWVSGQLWVTPASVEPAKA